MNWDGPHFRRFNLVVLMDALPDGSNVPFGLSIGPVLSS